ncbi:MAG: ABC transporter permease [Gemmatimonadota bacterium]
MRGALALIRASWQSALTYRIRLLISLASLLISVLPIYFIANALQDTMAESIAGQGSHYFAFLVVGTATFLLVPSAVNSLAGAVGSGISTGGFETLLGTRTPLPAVLAGMVGYGLLWTVLRALVLMVGAWVLGAAILWSQLGSAILIMGLIILAYVPFGLIGAALVISFRTAGPLPQAVLGVSALLGGVYYPTQVIPSWIESISAFVPLTYGLRALRGTLLEGSSLAAVLPELGMLALFIMILMSIGWLALGASLHHARRAGTLSHY